MGRSDPRNGSTVNQHCSVAHVENIFEASIQYFCAILLIRGEMHSVNEKRKKILEIRTESEDFM